MNIKKERKKKEIKEISIIKIILKILYILFLFVLFIILILIILKIIYNYVKKYLINKYFKIQLTNIFYNENAETLFNYNFKINDYLLISNKKYKILNIDYENKNNLLLILEDNKKIKISFFENKYEIKDYFDNSIIKNFKYISRKPYYISNCIEFIFILYNLIKEKNNNMDMDLIEKKKSSSIIKFKPQIKILNQISEFLNVKNKIGTQLNIVKTLNENLEKGNFKKANDVISNLNFEENKNFLNNLKKLILSILSKGLYDSKICNFKFNYIGSKEIELKELSKKDEIIFRGIYYFYQNKYYINEYNLISLNNKNCEMEKTNCKTIINSSLQPNLLFILLNSSINNYENFDQLKNIIDINTFFYPRINILLKEISFLFIENYKIFTTNEYSYESKSRLNKKLLFIDYNIILFLLRYSIYDFLRVLYNEYNGICCKFNNKLIYVKLNNIEEKKIIYNNI